MSKNKSNFSISKLINKQKSKDQSNSKPVNLEALVNSGRIRLEGDALKDVSKKR